MRRKQFQYVAATILCIQVVFLWCLLTPYSSIVIQDTDTVEVSVHTSASPMQFLAHRGITLREDDSDYFVHLGNGWPCYRRGIHQSRSQTLCVCTQNYYGKDCGIPAQVWLSFYRENEKTFPLKRRKYPRRIVHIVTVEESAGQFRLLQNRTENLSDTIDAYIILDTSKDFPLLSSRLHQGFLEEFQHKIVYVPRGINESLRTSTENGLDRIANRRDDDLVLFLQDDELPSREVLTFLKNYEGYPEPVSFLVRETPPATYRAKDEPRASYVTAACTKLMLRQVYLHDPTKLRRPLWDQNFVKRYFKYKSNARGVDFVIGTVEFPAVFQLELNSSTVLR